MMSMNNWHHGFYLLSICCSAQMFDSGLVWQIKLLSLLRSRQFLKKNLKRRISRPIDSSEKLQCDVTADNKRCVTPVFAIIEGNE